MHYLYRITNQFNGKVYIGQSNKETERWRQHKYYARQDEPLQYIHRAMAKYGVENFIYEVIATCQTQNDADELETQLIVQYDSRDKNNGYNVAPGGDHPWNAGLPSELQPMFGKQQSDYQKQKMSETHTGMKLPPHTDEWKQRQKKWMTGRPASKETREKIAEANRNKVVSNETRDKMSSSHLGSSLSEKHRKNISKSLFGIKRGPFSTEHKRNLSKAKMKFSLDQELEIVELRKLGMLIRELSVQFDCTDLTIRRVLVRHK